MQPTLMAIFAHPDDEAFSVAGTLARCAQEGVRVLLVCATRGEAGKITDPDMTVEDLGQQREAELRAACRELGVGAPIFLDYHDSGRFERTRHDDPRALMNVPLDAVEARLRALIAEHAPQVIVTFDPHGAYGHPDHLAIHRAASGAFFSTGHLPYPPQRLYYTALPLRAAELLRHMNPDAGLDPTVYGVSDDTMIARLDVSEQLGRKRAALAAHGSQTGSGSVYGRLSREQPELLNEWMSREDFSLGGTRTPLAYPLQGLFSGVRLP